MLHAKADRFGHSGMREQHFVNLARRNLFATAIDQLFQPADQMQVPFLVQIPLIAGTKPLIEKRRGVCLGIVFVSRDHVRTLNADFSALTSFERLSVRVPDADADLSARSD